MLRVALPGCVAAALLAAAAASVSEKVQQAPRRWYDHGPTITAEFGATGGNRSEAAAGSLVFGVGMRPGFDAVRWTTANISMPASLVESVCGSATGGGATFAYSINVKWGHGSGKTSGQGLEECGAEHTGKHWDPTAACSNESSNEACATCGTAADYKCNATTFSPEPDAMGSFAYRFLNEHACELGDLSGMHGELEAGNGGGCADVTDKCGAWVEKGECHEHPEFLELLCPKSCGVCAPEGHVELKAVSAGLAQMSTPFGVITAESVEAGRQLPSINCDALGPPMVHATDCDCLKYNGKRSPSIGTMTVFRPWDHETFYLGGMDFDAMRGRSVVIQCGSSFGANKGKPLMCAKLA